MCWHPVGSALPKACGVGQFDRRQVLRVTRSIGMALSWVALALVFGCGRHQEAGGDQPDHKEAANIGWPAPPTSGVVTVSGDDKIAARLNWRAPQVTITDTDVPAARKRAAAAMIQGHLYEDADAAIPLYRALLVHDAEDAKAKVGLTRAFAKLIVSGDKALAAAGDDVAALQQAQQIASVVRSVGVGSFEADALSFLGRVDLAERLWDMNEQAEHELVAGRLGEQGNGALPQFRQILTLAPGQPRAMQGLAAVESALIRRAEEAALTGDFMQAERWLQQAAKIRPGFDTILTGRERVETIRLARIATLRNEGMQLLQQPNLPNHLKHARERLAEMLHIATPGDASASVLRERIDLTAHYGQLRPGLHFADPLDGGGQGPQMIVVPHGGFRMGARANEMDGDDAERPVRYVRFERGFAMGRTEVTVADFRRFVLASGYRPRAVRRGHSLVYDPRAGNFVRRSGVDWRDDYAGHPAADNMPVLHVSAKDAEAYTRWLSERSQQRYRLPSEAEFEYAVRAGTTSRFVWGDGAPPSNSGNFTGALDRSPDGRRWGNAFVGYGDRYWGPAPVASFRENAFGLYDLDGNVSEWVADCWHDGYRRAPTQGDAWVNPGCRTRVVRGGAWASSPAQTRSAWRIHAEADVTNARTGFRVVRDL